MRQSLLTSLALAVPLAATAGLALTSGCLPSQSAATRGSGSVFELRLAYADSARERDRYTYGDSAIYLARPALLSDADITSAQTSMSASGELVLRVDYGTESGRRVATMLRDRIGGHLALLLASRVTDVVVIASAVGAGGSLTVNTGLTGPDAERFREVVRTRWPAH